MSNYKWGNVLNDWITWNEVKANFSTWGDLKNYEIPEDKFRRFEEPVILLKNPVGTTLHILKGINNRNVSLRFNDISEFTFEAYKYNNKGIENGYYSQLEARRLVEIQGLMVFSITNVQTIGNGIFEKKIITTRSIEKEIARKNVGYLEGTFKLYDIANPNTTILGKLMEYIPDWNIGYVDASLLSLYRTFNITSDLSLYNFMIKDIEEAYRCIFRFNTITKTIDVYAVENAIKKTSILMNYRNLIKEIKVDESDEELATSLSVFGGGDLSIRKVNPLGTSSIYDFSYYKNTNWMSQGLVDALTRWENKCNGSTSSYEKLLSNLKTEQDNLLKLEIELKELETELSVLEQELAIKVQAKDDTSIVNSKITSKQAQIKNKKIDIENKKVAIKQLNTQLETMHTDLDINSKNFTREQLNELSYFTIQSTYTDDTFIQTDEMTDSEVLKMEQELYDQAKKILKRISQPRYSFNMNCVNLLNIPEFKVFKDQLDLGCEVTIDMGNDTFSYPVLLEMSFNYDDYSKLDLKFSNRLRLGSDEYIFEELFGKTISVSSTIDHESHKWGKGEEAERKVNELINNALDASKNKIISSTDQEVTFDTTGIRCKKFIPESQTYDPKEVWVTANTIGFTRDGWNNCALALGEIELNGVNYFGLVADAIVGRMIISEELLIQNENMSFSVTKDQVTIRNGNIIITNDDGVDEGLKDYVDSGVNKISSDLSNAITGVYGDMAEMEQAIKDGEIVIFYQSTQPSIPPAKNGDIWYNTAKKNEAKLVKNNAWVSIKDQQIIDALDKAESAQTTADGKIQTFWRDYAPKNGDMINGKIVKLGEGDLWFDTNDGNKQYRWTSVLDATQTINTWEDLSIGGTWNDVKSGYPNWGSVKNKTHTAKWIPVQDKAIQKLSEDVANSIDDIFHQIVDMEAAISDGMIEIFYQDTQPVFAKEGDMWYNTSKKNEAWLYTGGIWTSIKDGEVLEALDKANTAQITADGKIKCYFQPNQPSEGSEGDIWYDTDDKNKPYVYSNGSWKPARDGGVTEALDKVNNVINPDGSLNPSKMEGEILAGKSNVICSSTSTGKKVVLNENGILIATKNAQGQWIGKTAINADGVYADNVTAGANIVGANVTGSNINGTTINGGSITIGGGKEYTYKMVDGNPFLMFDNNASTEFPALTMANYQSSGGIRYVGINTGNSILSSPYFKGTTFYGNGIIHSGQSMTIGHTPSSRFVIYVDGNFEVGGDKAAIIPTQHYGTRTLYCDESDRSYFTTKGLAATVDNTCVVKLDPIFMETIEMNTNFPYIINITPYGDARVWVDDVQNDYFVVKSDKDVRFAYQLNATRISFGEVYLEKSRVELDKSQLSKLQDMAVGRMDNNAMQNYPLR